MPIRTFGGIVNIGDIGTGVGFQPNELAGIIEAECVGSAVQASLRIRQISLTGPFHSPISYASTTQNQPKYPKYSI